MSYEKMHFASSSHGKMHKNLLIGHSILPFIIDFSIDFHIPNLNTWANDKLEPIKKLIHYLKIFNENLYLLKH